MLVSLAIFLLDFVSGRLRGPQAETIVVLHHGDAAPHAGSFGGFEPLPGIGRCCGCKEIFALIAIAPLLVGVGVHAVVKESIKLGFLPFQLARVRHGVHRSGFVVGIRQYLIFELKSLTAQRNRSCPKAKQCKSERGSHG